VARWHLLALTFKIIMFLLYLELSLKGFSRTLISWLTVGGFALVIIGGFFYMLSPMFVGTPVHEIAIRSLEIKNNVLPIIEIGATLLLISLLFTFFKLLKIK
jgi:dolichyl-phosphate-mannose--protein O-mannosyl transferase